jgi:hypothetical protein
MPRVTVESLRRFVEKRGAVTGVVVREVREPGYVARLSPTAHVRYLLTEPGAGSRLVNPIDRI